MAIKPIHSKEFKASSSGLRQLQFPLIWLIFNFVSHNHSKSPLFWTKHRILKQDPLHISHEGWETGRILELLIIHAFNILNFKKSPTPEKLRPPAYFENCDTSHNGYGSDFIAVILNHLSKLRHVLVEAKVRTRYLSTEDIIRSVLPRFIDLDAKHLFIWILIYWGTLSHEARLLLKENRIHLITIPFDVNFIHQLTPHKQSRIASYIAARLDDLFREATKPPKLPKPTHKRMSQFTASMKTPLEEAKEIVGKHYYCDLDDENKSLHHHYREDFSDLLSDFNHNVLGHHRHLTKEAIKQRNIWRQYEMLCQEDELRRILL